jgi:2-polyprenyl-3-methyl-5-hydroxy-6-metoxy-1,4-benzoquinol methylase
MTEKIVCPVCNNANVVFALNAKDYTVSSEEFGIYHCNECSFRFTNNIPTQDQIGRYYQSNDYISHSDTKKGIVNNLYHKVRSITLSQKKNFVFSFTKKSKGDILDIGCGTGAFLNTMKKSGWNTIGLEPDAIASNKAKELYNIDAKSPEELFNLQEKSFDAVTMWHVLEHVHQLHEYIIQLNKILKDDGVLFVAVPNYTSFDATHYKQFWAAYDVPRHLYHFSPQSMSKLLGMHSFEIVEIKPMWFDSIYVSMLSEKYKNKGNILKAFFIGMLSNVVTLFNKNKCSSIIYVIRKVR